MDRSARGVRRFRKWMRDPHAWTSVQSTGGIVPGLMLGLIVLGVALLLMNMLGR
jgi:hypothetical protein